MIGKPTRPLRYFTLLLAAMQFALPAVASVADGLYAATGRNDGSHVEDVARNQCKPPHAGDCAICRYLTGTPARTENTSELQSRLHLVCRLLLEKKKNTT